MVWKIVWQYFTTEISKQKKLKRKQIHRLSIFQST